MSDTNAPRSITEPLIGCVQHDCAECKSMAERLVRFEQAELPEEWGDKAERMSDMHITTSGDIQKWMQDEIDALRAHAASATVKLAAANERAETAEKAQKAIQATCIAQAKSYDKQADEIMWQRDCAENALQDTHIILGGNGEWKGKLPPENPPNSGDLKADVPALAEWIVRRAESAEITTLENSIKYLRAKGQATAALLLKRISYKIKSDAARRGERKA